MNKFIKVRTYHNTYHIINADAIIEIYVLRPTAYIKLNNGEEIETEDIDPLLSLIENEKPQPKKKELDLNQPIENVIIKLPRRQKVIYNALASNGVKTVQDLIDFKAKGKKIKGVSNSCIDWVLRFAEKED